MRRRQASTAARGALAALLLGAGLAPFGAPPAAAVDGQADNEARYSACMGEALAPSVFTDIEDSFAEDAVNCLAYYRIARGGSSALFSPGNSITRWQMALFLVRAAEAAGADLPEPADQGFTDIGALGSSTHRAVNQLAAMGVTRGIAEGRFSPYGPVTRRQMALFLYRFMGGIPIGEGGVEAGEVTPDDTRFEDIGHLSGAARRAVLVMYEMGITSGASETRFSPSDRVSRGQMAVFIARVLDHSNARPAGVTIQADRASAPAGDTINLHFAVRDEQRRPVRGAYLDIFSISPRRWGSAFDQREYCSEEVQGLYAGEVCQIDRGDRRTDDLGNVSAAVEFSESKVLWAWTGALFEVFREGLTEAGSIEISVAQPAARLVVQDDMPTGAARLRLGEQVAFTMQLTDRSGNPTPTGGVGVRVSTRIDEGGVRGRPAVKTYSTDSFGRVRLTFRQPDPDPSALSIDDYTKLVLEVTAPGLEVVDRTTVQVLADGGTALSWVEEEAEPLLLRLRQEKSYHLVAAAGPGVANLVTATLTDQYGEPVEGARLEFTSDDRRGVGPDARRSITDSRGTVRFRYLRDGSSTGTETITVRLPGEEEVEAAQVRHHWSTPHRPVGYLGAVILAVDVSDNVIVLYPDSPMLVRYDSNDGFTVEGAVRTLTEFEEALQSGAYKRLSFRTYDPVSSVSNGFDLSNDSFYDSA